MNGEPVSALALVVLSYGPEDKVLIYPSFMSLQIKDPFSVQVTGKCLIGCILCDACMNLMTLYDCSYKSYI